jgi:hypothetical protein
VLSERFTPSRGRKPEKEACLDVFFVDMNGRSVKYLLAGFGNGYEPTIASSVPARAEADACSMKLPGQEVAEGNTPYSRGETLIGKIGIGSGNR